MKPFLTALACIALMPLHAVAGGERPIKPPTSLPCSNGGSAERLGWLAQHTNEGIFKASKLTAGGKKFEFNPVIAADIE